MTDITSVNNSRVKDIAKLIRSAKSRRERNLFIAEGMRLVAEVPPERLEELYIEEGFLEKVKREDKYKDKILGLVERAEEKRQCYLVSSAVMEKMSDTDTPQGIMAVAAINKEQSVTAPDREDSKEQKRFYIIIDRLQDPGNMGTIIRTAEGAGVTGIIVSRDSADPYSPKVVRSAMGSLFRMDISVSDDLVEDIRRLRKNGVKICGTHLSGTEFYDEDFSGDIAFLIGNEGSGLSDEVSAEADTLLRIPMEGQVESLNAAVSAAVVMYEVLRQRKKLS